MRLIDADILYVDWYDSFVADDGTEYDNIPFISKGQIDDAPTIEPKCGEWIQTSNDWIDGACGAMFYPYHCSSCGYETYDDYDGLYNFCPNCGADMRNCSEILNNCDTCRFELYCPEMCEGCCEWDSHYEPKDEPQTKRPWGMYIIEHPMYE